MREFCTPSVALGPRCVAFGLLIAGCLELLQVVTNESYAAETSKPNILLIVSDDQGYNDLGVLGNGIITPSLDRLAREGTRLTSFYVAWPACTPSRAALLTGRYPQRNGIYDMIRNEAPDYGHKYTADEYAVTFERIGGMDEREIIIPKILAGGGYQSGIYGKWDLGALRRFLPRLEGLMIFMDSSIRESITTRTSVMAFRACTATTHRPRKTKVRIAPTYLSEKQSVFSNDTRGTTRSSCMCHSMRRTTRLPWIRQFARLCKHPMSSNECIPTSILSSKRSASTNMRARRESATKEARRRDYRAAVTCMDAAIGKMLDLLEDKNLLDNTIVVFFSDNGGSGGADNSPLRGSKGKTWEGGIRVPCLVRWPDGGVPAGVVTDEFLTSLELLPSFAAATGAELPDDLILDGYDWWPVLCKSEPSPRTEMFWQRKNTIGARVGNWKWVDMAEAGGGLYDLASDIGEQHDLSKDRPDILQHVQQRYQAWVQRMDAAEPRGPFRDF